MTFARSLRAKLHFAAMWLLVVNGLIYVAFIYLHGEWRDLVPRRGHLRDSWEMVKFYLFLRKNHPRQGKHNALQRGAYFAMPIVGLVLVLTGLAIWKPVQLGLLTSCSVDTCGRDTGICRDVAARAARRRARVHGLRRRSILHRAMVTGRYKERGHRKPATRGRSSTSCRQRGSAGDMDEQPGQP